MISFSSSSLAEAISCTDENGNMIFTNNTLNCQAEKSIQDVSNHDNYPPVEKFYDEIPDLLQTLASAHFPGGGVQFCGPVAVSNSLVWLEGIDDEAYQIDLVHKLSSSDYMGTNEDTGTSATGILKGVDRYITEVFGSYEKLEYSGWRKAPVYYRLENERPTVAFMQTFLNKKGAAWLNVGWYEFNPFKNEYKRVGGHWVTLVGHENGQLVIHDPAPRAGKAFSNEFVTYSIIKAGKLVGSNKGLPQLAKGLYKLGKGMHIPKKADMAIIDGVIGLQL